MKTIAFYSYKGGVGRTLAVAHVAYWLGSLGKKVFLLDMDLEAPGLHYKMDMFNKPVQPEKGLVDYVADFLREDAAPASLAPYVKRLESQTLGMPDAWLMPAGNPFDQEYWRRWNAVNWKEFVYGPDKAGALLFLELQAHIAKEYAPDFLLIDCRTGITDLTGVGVELLADEALVFAVNNSENIDGARIVLERLRDRERVPVRDHKTRAHFVLTRIPAPKKNHERGREEQIKGKVLERLNQGSGIATGPLVRKVNVIHIDEEQALGERNRFAEKEWSKYQILFDYQDLVAEVTGLGGSGVNAKFIRALRSFMREFDARRKQKLAVDLVSIETTMPDLEFERGWIAIDFLEHFTTAMKAFSNVVTLQPDNAWAFNNLGGALAKLGEFEASITEYSKAIELRPSLGEVYYNRGLAYSRLGKFELAISDFSKTMEFEPENSEALNSRGTAYILIGKYELAIADFDKVVELDSTFVRAYENRGNALAGLGKYELAIVDYNKSIELRPDFVEAFYNRGLAYSYLGNYDLAIADQTQAIELSPDYTEAYHNRGFIYANLGKYDISINDYSKAIELKPDHSLAYNNRANSYYHLGNLRLALADVETSLVLDASVVHAHYTLADIQSALGNTEAFYQALEKGIALDASLIKHLDPQTVARHAGEPRFQALTAR